MSQGIGQSYTIPPAIGGWNAKDALDLMPEADASILTNLFPDIGQLVLRNGMRSHSTGMTGSVDSLFEYVAQDGTRKLIAAANNNLWDATTYGGTASSLGSGYSTNYWYGINFHQKLLLCNGTDQPLKYDGSSLSTASYSGISDNNTLVHWNSYRARLYGVEINSASVWYGGIDSVTGALTEFDVQGILTKGGYLLWTNSYTRDKGSGAQDLFLMLSNMGELLIYSGAYPGDTAWQIVGHFYLPAPIGRRSFAKLDADVAILTQLGLIPLSSILSDSDSRVTDKITDAFQKASMVYSTNAGWEVIYYPQGHWLLVNIPITSNNQSQQYVMNTITGAWCKFTGLNGFCWSLLNDKIYFGGAAGVVYQADVGSTDNGNFINWDLKQAFNYFGDRTRKKQATLAKPIIFGDTAAQFLIGLDTDFSNKTTPTTSITSIGSTGSTWDVDHWDTAAWDTGSVFNDKWTGVSGLGRCFALRLSGSFKNSPFSLDATQIIYKTGSVL